MTQAAYDFDTVIDRRHTDNIKFDQAALRGHAEDEISLWVADMDFALPPEVARALQERLDHGVFGYSAPNDDYYQAVHDWFAQRYGWETRREWIVNTPGVVFALATAIRAFARPGDGVLVQPPVYYPFSGMVRANGCRVVEAPLALGEDELRYHVDFGEFERIVAQQKPKVFLLCNPHNPGGRVWTRGELEHMGDICLAHDVIVVSDEIHQDFAREGHRHVVFAAIKPEFAARSITCTSPSKSFNIAGLQISNIFIPDEGLRARYRACHRATGYGELNSLGIVAGRACYRDGGPWLAALKRYLEGNLEFMQDYLACHAPQLRVMEPESTYLVWVDCRGLGFADDELERWVSRDAKLWLDMGTMFGKAGSGFIRFNIACPRATLERALHQLAAALPQGA